MTKPSEYIRRDALVAALRGLGPKPDKDLGDCVIVTPGIVHAESLASEVESGAFPPQPQEPDELEWDPDKNMIPDAEWFSAVLGDGSVVTVWDNGQIDMPAGAWSVTPAELRAIAAKAEEVARK